jgi:DnaJ-class molecular chaperone
MTKEIKQFIKSHGALVCPSCEGEGEVEYFCGHYTTNKCRNCAGKGLVASLKKQKQSKKCIICNGRDGGCGGCNSNPKGLIEWESYEIYQE